MSEQYKAVLYCLCRTIDARFALKAMKNAEESLTFPLRYAKAMGENSFYSFQQEDYNAFLRKENHSALRCSIASSIRDLTCIISPSWIAQQKRSPGGGSEIYDGFRRRAGSDFADRIYPAAGGNRLIIPAGNLSKRSSSKDVLRDSAFIPWFPDEYKCFLCASREMLR